MILRAAYVLDEKFRAQPNWAVRVVGDRIAEVGPAHRFSGDSEIDLADVLLMPGLVNAHTHLELGFLDGKVPPGNSLADWLSRLVPYLRDVPRDAPEIAAGIEAGLESALRSGTTLLGDITRAPQTTRATIAAVPRRPAMVSFGEVIAIGALRGLIDLQLNAATARLPNIEALAIGISTHAPYTVEPDLLASCAARARADNLPLCIHAAESEEEILFIREGRGPLRDFLETAGVWDDHVPIPGCSPIELLERCGALGPQTLLAHCNYLSDTDLDIIAKSGASVVHCPRTHAAFGHPRHPFAELQARGVNVCLGTDSLASNPSLSMLEEARFLHRARRDVAPGAIFQMATTCGARALDVADHTGRISANHCADLIAAQLPIGTKHANALEHVLANQSPIARVLVSGRWCRE
jgi:cytosine/adenosine deaminase-related metal-dependent hydrolase